MKKAVSLQAHEKSADSHILLLNSISKFEAVGL